MTKGLTFDQLFPGAYIKAGEFNGRTPTWTIKAVKREMLSNGAGGEEPAVTVAFEEFEKQWVMNKTNATALRAMWGDDSGEWVGHQLTLHAVKDESGMSDSGLCIRVLGSPELDKPLKFQAHLGRKVVKQTMQPTSAATMAANAPEAAQAAAGEALNADTGEVTPAGEALPAIAADEPEEELL